MAGARTLEAPTATAWAVPFGLGEISVVNKVVGFKKIRFHTHENVGFGEVHLPEMQMHTSAFWMISKTWRKTATVLAPEVSGAH